MWILINLMNSSLPTEVRRNYIDVYIYLISQLERQTRRFISNTFVFMTALMYASEVETSFSALWSVFFSAAEILARHKTTHHFSRDHRPHTLLRTNKSLPLPTSNPLCSSYFFELVSYGDLASLRPYLSTAYRTFMAVNRNIPRTWWWSPA